MFKFICLILLIEGNYNTGSFIISKGNIYTQILKIGLAKYCSILQFCSEEYLVVIKTSGLSNTTYARVQDIV